MSKILCERSLTFLKNVLKTVFTYAVDERGAGELKNREIFYSMTPRLAMNLRSMIVHGRQPSFTFQEMAQNI